MFSNWRFTDFSTKLNGYYLWKPWKVKKNWIEPSLIKFGLVKWNIIINNGDHMYGSVSILPFMVCYINCYGILWYVCFCGMISDFIPFKVSWYVTYKLFTIKSTIPCPIPVLDHFIYCFYFSINFWFFKADSINKGAEFPKWPPHSVICKTPSQCSLHRCWSRMLERVGVSDNF